MADFSTRKIFTVPNFVSASRILMVPVIGWLLLIDSVPSRIAAALVLALAIFSDFLDGWLARVLDQASDLGRIIDPLADKLFVIFLAIELILLRDFPLWLALVIIFKDLVIVVAGVVVAGHKRVVMESNIIGKYAFAFQAGLVVCYFLGFQYGMWFFTIASLIFIAASLISYGKTFAFVLRSEEEEVVVPKSPQYLPTWARRLLVLILTTLMAAQFYYWALENNEIDLTISEDRAFVNIEELQAVELAERFSPVFVFSAEEDTRPVAVETYLKYSDLRQGSRYFLAAFDSGAEQGPLISDDLKEADSADAYLALSDTRWTGENAEVASNPTVYTRVCSISDGEEEWIVLQYWLLFPIEEKPVRRLGDWQMAAVYLDSEGKPLYLALTQGWYGSVYPWGDVKLEGEHPVVYVAPGSHSQYSEQGEFGAFLDHERVFPAGRDVTSAGDEFRAAEDYTLVVLTGEEQWIAWPGRWGGPLPGGDRGPRYWNPKKPERAPWSQPLAFLEFYLE